MNTNKSELISKLNNLTESEIISIDHIVDELVRAKSIHPQWPYDPVHRAAIVSEESGELVKATNDFVTGKTTSMLDMQSEATQTGAMAIRFLSYFFD